MKPPRLKSHAELALQCEAWNSQVPVGALVKYHPVIGAPEHRIRRTRSAAYILSGHTVCLFLEEESGCVAVDACVPVAEVKPQ